jgi:hypothetical protein
MTRERIEDFREIVLPFVKKRLLETNYENLGKSDAEEFTRDFNEILDLAIKALEQLPKLQNRCHALTWGQMCFFCPYECEHRVAVEPQESEET